VFKVDVVMEVVFTGPGLAFLIVQKAWVVEKSNTSNKKRGGFIIDLF
jgi:hypothetical protein